MRVFSLARLTARERHVIGLLRGADPVSPAGTLSDLFAGLRNEARRVGYRDGPRDGSYATAHELCLLGVLAGLQRDQPDPNVRLHDRMHPIAIACARQLSRDGIFLHHTAFVRLTGMADTCIDLSIMLVPSIRSPTRRPVTLPSPGTLQAEALRFVRRRGDTSTRDFADHGISRQVVSLMHRRGLLERVRFSVYRATAEAARG